MYTTQQGSYWNYPVTLLSIGLLLKSMDLMNHGFTHQSLNVLVLSWVILGVVRVSDTMKDDAIGPSIVSILT